MATAATTFPHTRRWLTRLIVASLLIGVVLVTLSVVAGYGLNLRGFARAVLNSTLAVLNSNTVTQYSTGEYKNIIFLHHSVGAGLVEQGGLRDELSAAGYTLWDQGYNYLELRNPAGQTTGYAYTVPDENTDPDGLARVFSQPVFGLPVNALSGLLQHEVIIYKSCFPASAIGSDEALQQGKAYYLQMRQTIDRYPEKVFILLTQPPLNPAETNPADARRAHALADWLMSEEFRQGRTNLFTFDLFEQLAEGDAALPDANMLRAVYRTGGDSHPNSLASQTIAPQLARFVIDAIGQFKATRP